MIDIDRLSNGIQTIIEPIPHVRSVAMGIYVQCGSAYEDQENNGISHMIEHMLFKGTANHTAKELAIKTTLLGDDVNAFTSKELTCYYAKVIDEKLPELIELFGDMFCNSLFAEEDLMREKSVIYDEIDMYEDSPEDLVQEQFQRVVWKDHPLGYIISGTKENVERITGADLREYYKKNYTGDRILISIAGNVTVGTVKEMLEKQFHCIPASHSQTIRTFHVPEYRPAKQSFSKETEQVHLCVGLPGVSYRSEHYYTLSILNSIFGGSSCSRLFQQIREDKGLCYTIFSYLSCYLGTGTFQIYSAMGEEDVEEVYSGIYRIFKELKSAKVTSEEIGQTMAQIRSELILAQENTNSRMDQNARNMLYHGRMITMEETIAQYEKVSREAIMDYMNSYMKEDQLSMTIVGDFEDRPSLQRIYDGL